jgi:tetratricopeptide (TPR) repeat protein
LATRGGEAAWEESQRLLEPAGAQSTVDEQRLQAVLLLRRGGKDNLRKARRILEKLTADAAQSTTEDYLLLARVLEIEGLVDEAHQQYLAVVSREGVVPAYLLLYVDFLLRHGASNEATPWLEKLQQRRPEDLSLLALRARWLRAQQRTPEIEPAVEALGERLLKKLPVDDQKRAAEEAQLLQRIGNVYSGAEQHVAAERWYRRLVKLAPQRYAPLAVSLGRQNRRSEAVAVCVEAAKTDSSPQPAVIVANILTAGPATAAECDLAEPLLARALATHGNSVELLNAVAGVRVLEQRTDDAISLYRRIVAVKPGDALALNNLATLLSERSSTRPEALHSIDQAINVAGRLPVLLDTKGTVLIYDGKAAEAVSLLKEATTGSEPDPRFLFHLSLACERVGKQDDARAALKMARAGKLGQQLLTPADRQLLKELELKLGL